MQWLLTGSVARSCSQPYPNPVPAITLAGQMPVRRQMGRVLTPASDDSMIDHVEISKAAEDSVEQVGRHGSTSQFMAKTSTTFISDAVIYVSDDS